MGSNIAMIGTALGRGRRGVNSETVEAYYDKLGV
jgi:hypothetical protein